MDNKELLYGRDLLLSEVNGLPTLNEEEMRNLSQRIALSRVTGRYRCERCGSVNKRDKRYLCVCGKNCLYCKACLNLGKVRACDTLVSLDEPNVFSSVNPPSLKWKGQLSEQQKKASEEIDQSMHMNQDRVVWAVTGAGKTEMLFEGIGNALDCQKRVCLATPRIDVCLELAPRLKQAFPDTSLAVLYGSAEEEYAYTQLVIATTHQLLRFKGAFDVLIIDEIDAFPFYLNKMLYYAATKAIKHESSTIFMTATPDAALKKRIRRQDIQASVLPARYHKHPLPVPSISHLTRNDCLARCMREMHERVKQKKRFLLFVPTLSLLEDLMTRLENTFSSCSFTSVHSEDRLRKEKVVNMRLGYYDFLVTTTILERGVTFSDIAVIVLHAEHRVYTEAALVQIAGRAGRSSAHPSGEVLFYCTYYTKGIKGAVKEIEAMNRLALKRGLIK